MSFAGAKALGGERSEKHTQTLCYALVTPKRTRTETAMNENE